ncbi:dynein regulatory complex protein 9 isoform X2 [Bombyx mori]|uniref:dynein regulatory complex protein 9 isoform X2 n=1 Tax=Bombyx mori TaxID=7091 RepID=UPI000640B40A
MEFDQRISKMDALLFTLSMEVVLLQLRILEGCSELRAQQWKPLGGHERQKREKLLRDRSSVKETVRQTLISVAERGDWQVLRESIEILKRRATSVVTKRINKQQLKMTLMTIIEELKMKSCQFSVELRDADQIIATLRDQRSDEYLNASTRLCYTEKWLQARAESLELECNIKREPLPRTDHEQRVHDELLKAYSLQIAEREKSLEYWHSRYAVDTATINRRLKEKADQFRCVSARRAELQKLYDLHEGEMRAWLTFKKERAARLLREKRLRDSATRIQAWWRGVMVRRALGAFRHLRNAKKLPTKGKKK